MDIDEKRKNMKVIRDEVIALQNSTLADKRRVDKKFPVIGEGDHNATILFVGEAPGKNEADTGRPFCGSAGKILDMLLDSISVKREKVYITNIVKDRPPGNRDPLPEEIELYGPFLDRQIDIIAPKVIATLGRFSMVYSMEKFGLKDLIEPISSAHGKIFSVETAFGRRTIVPLYHPAAAIYNASLKSTLLKDFQILKTFL